MTSYLQTLKNLQQQQQRVQTPLNQVNQAQFDKQTHIQLNNQNYSALRSIPIYNQQAQVYYVPHKAKIIDYQDRIVVEKVPKTRKVLQYQERVIKEVVPRQVFKTQYYAVQHLRYYQKQIVPQVKIEYVPVQKKVKKIQYVAVPKQIIYYPQSVQANNQQTIQKIAKVDLLDSGVSLQANSQIRPLTQNGTRLSNISVKESGSTMAHSPYKSYQKESYIYQQPSSRYLPMRYYEDNSNQNYYDYVVENSPRRRRNEYSQYNGYNEQNYYKNKYYLNKLKNRFGIQQPRDISYKNKVKGYYYPY